MSKTTNPTLQLDLIARRAARNNLDADYQFAEHDAFGRALRAGFNDSDAEECAKAAGLYHQEFLEVQGDEEDGE